MSISQVRLMLEEFVDCMNLKDSQKEKFLPIWNTHRNKLAKMVKDYGESEFNRGKDQNIELNHLG